VAEVADTASEYWGEGASWFTSQQEHPHEANLLALDASKAASSLKWKNKLTFPASLEWTVEWHKRVESGANPRVVTHDQIDRFENID
jgi:CDP-glucose 4,6-dehydratase